jgi:metallo-beta-lactamase family protein
MQIKLTFLGAAGNVTGSRYLVEVDGIRILVDCGLYQERQFQDRNWDPFPIPPSSLDAVLLTHAHLDHCGLLPKLVKDGFNGPVYCTEATAEIARIVMLDAGHIMEEDAAYKRKRHKREGRIPPHPVVPLYTVDDAAACDGLFAPVKYEQAVTIGDCAEVTFHEAGHILGASMINVRLSCNGLKRTILFSGDVGRNDKPLINDPTDFEQADYVLVESTYGERVHEDVDDIKEKMTEAVNATRAAGGNVIIPSFSVERSQEVLYYLHELLMEKKIPPIMAFLDSPMAIRVTEVFNDHPEMLDDKMRALLANHDSPFDFKGLKMTRTTRESKAINSIRGTVIVIAGSGMCTGGRIKHHLINNISRPESTILFVGYQAQGTLGRLILDGARQVRIFGEMVPVKARVERITGFSAHADRSELLRWAGALASPPRRAFVIHGEPATAQRFAETLQKEKGWSAMVPAAGQAVELE